MTVQTHLTLTFTFVGIAEQNRTYYLFDVNYTVSSQSNTIIIYISRSQILSIYLNQDVVHI